MNPGTLATYSHLSRLIRSASISRMFIRVDFTSRLTRNICLVCSMNGTWPSIDFESHGGFPRRFRLLQKNSE